MAAFGSGRVADYAHRGVDAMRWLRFLFQEFKAEKELDSELRFHLDELIEANIAAGMSPAEARRQAILDFGGSEQVKEECRDVHRIPVVEHAATNLKSALRFIRKSPTFSLAIILTLALGIGANSAVFSAIDAVLLKPLPFPNADRLMLLRQYDRKTKNPNSLVAPVRLENWKRLNTTFQAMFGYLTQDVSETSGTLPEEVTEAAVSPGFLQVWGVSPALGRDFTAKEEHFGGPHAILISDRFWHRRFHADPIAIGKSLRLEKYSYIIVGVMPASFRFPDHDVDIWCPSPSDAPYAQDRLSTWYTVIGRLKPGITIARARANMAQVQAQLGREFPKADANLSVGIEPLKENIVGGVRRSLWMLFGAVSLLLLIACTNIAALLLARTTAPQQEIWIRFSLGASRASVVAQLLTESLVLALIGSLLGLFLAGAASSVFRTLAKSMPRVEEITLDWRIVLYSLAVGVFATVLFGAFPAIRGTRSSIAGVLAQNSRTQIGSRASLQWLLVGTQVALAFTLLIGAGLLLRSFQALGRVSPGFDPTHVLTFRISGNWGETGDMKTLTQRINRTLDELRAVPGVSAAATSATLPGIADDFRTEVKLVEGRAQTEGKIVADSRFVSNGYFATMKIPMLAGEGCRESVNLGSVVVNRGFVNRYLSGSPAVGHHLELVGNSFVPPAEIRGIAADAREQGLNAAPAPTVYWCVSAPGPSPYFLVRTHGEPMAMAETLRRKIHSIDPARSVFDISPLEQHLSDSFAENRLRTLLLGLFAFTAISLACIGLYGTLSYSVSVRRREIGLRMALGALPNQIRRHFVFQGVRVSLLGCLVGTALAAGFSRALSGMLYGISDTDAVTFWGVGIIVLVVAAMSSLLPAIRAARLDPMRTLREE